jgi:hypothetical protein
MLVRTDRFHEQTLAFFWKYHADKYIISSEPVASGGSNNPDTIVLRAIILAHRDLKLDPPQLYMTNGCSPVGLDLMSFDADRSSSSDPWMREPIVKFKDKSNFGAALVLPGNGSAAAESGWTPITGSTEHFNYFRGYMSEFIDWVEGKAGETLRADGTPVTLGEFLTDKAFTLTLGEMDKLKPEEVARRAKLSEKEFAKLKKQLHLDQRSFPAWMRIPKDKHFFSHYGDSLLSSSSSTTFTPSTGTGTDSTAATAAPSIASSTSGTTSSSRSKRGRRRRPRALLRAIAPTPAPEKKALSWHEIMIAGIEDPLLVGDTDLDDIPQLDAPVQNVDRHRTGQNFTWQGMNEFLDYISEGLLIDAAWLRSTRSLLLPLDSSKPHIILLSTLLATIFDPEFASNLLCKLRSTDVSHLLICVQVSYRSMQMVCFGRSIPSTKA